ncbi:MAG: hypothetical protein COV74_10580 [Candidatus Omnitrophica bacterium CG11_big_fil_rev_8_21_14_0_20_45_26]|uniref:HEAT repeat domain-containing protein n=1 Tax=Candidatus Abzuiibacterium crystallinum TaxID=1974748 RepID=A0A2H0LNG5_9BACT|nr:MAG: hypothetical protein COV74_10580 [Candidatus Omnitrophica bacterium CG11_big_fil_rev_8_21_14_0_20_45_26]PIW63888.1 MAG: hypothetical protein COW12_08230 [Candidatus Omnitrophica bacterium CG12_big_fil_rev_8_21_14_0_65_45_16]
MIPTTIVSVYNSETIDNLMSTLRKTFFFCLVGMALICALAVAGTDEAQLIYALKNPDAVLEDRIKAADKLGSQYENTAGPELLNILFDTKAPRSLQTYIQDVVIKMKNPHLTDKLLKEADNIEANPYMREMGLYTAWKYDPDAALMQVRKIVGDSYDQLAFRMIAATYLIHDADNLETQEVAIKIMRDKSEPTELRRIVLPVLERSEYYEEALQLMKTAVTDPNESSSFRRMVIERMKDSKSSLLTETLMTILQDKNEKKDMKLLAIHTLKENAKTLKSQLPTLMKIKETTDTPLLKSEIQTLIEEILTATKTQTEVKDDWALLDTAMKEKTSTHSSQSKRTA